MFSHLGAPPEHGGELEPAFVMHRGAGHAAPTLPRLFEQASGGVLSAGADQIDFKSSPVELYFFKSAAQARRALPGARRELAGINAPDPEARMGATGNVIYFETGPVASKSVDAISECLRQNGGEPIP